MSLEPIQQSPLARLQASDAINHGAVAIEQERAIAEVQAKIAIAKRFPRDTLQARRDLEDACKLVELAQSAFYSVPRGGSTVTGPSIRLAEEIARCWGNIDYGHRELSRSDGKSEVEVYAWDMQTNTFSRRQLTIPHWRDTKSGGFPLRDTKEIDDLIANKASKQLRGRILAIVPKGLLQSAIDQCRLTLQGGNGKPIPERLPRMVQAFEKIKVTKALLEKRLGHALDETTEEELADLYGIYQSIKDGHTKIEEWLNDDDASAADEKPVINTAGAPSQAAQQPASLPRRRAAQASAKPPEQQEAAPEQAEKGTNSKKEATNTKYEQAAQPVQATHEQPAEQEELNDNGNDDPF